jgi:hypothetical protein
LIVTTKDGLGLALFLEKRCLMGLGDWRETTRNLKGSSKERNQTLFAL